MTESAARIGLELVAVFFEVVGLAEIGERRHRPFQPAGEILEEAVSAFQRCGAGGESLRAELRREDAVVGRVTGMQRLGHGAEIRRHAARERRRDAHDVGDALGRDLDEPRACRGRGDGADGAGRMPAGGP